MFVSWTHWASTRLGLLLRFGKICRSARARCCYDYPSVKKIVFAHFVTDHN
jgi:hypothetical protein